MQEYYEPKWCIFVMSYKILLGARVLKAGVAVGVAVDLDARKIFFASDGNWDESPAFDEEDYVVSSCPT